MPKGRIWRVRDDIVLCGSAASADLRIRGFQVVDYIFNPEAAYNYLSTEKQEGLAVVDVSLVSRDIPRAGRFGSENTNGFYLTGVKLMEELIAANPRKFPEHAMLMTIADPVTSIYKDAKEFCRVHRIPLIEGRDVADPYEFGNVVQKRYEQVFGRRVD